MLEKVDLDKKLSKEDYKREITILQERLGELQRECQKLQIPVMILFEGFGASGKGVQIGKLIQSLDPRGFCVYTTKAETKEERMHPFLWRFWTKTPEKGRIAIFDGSWYRKVLIDRFEKKTKGKEIKTAYESIRAFEKQLTDDGCVLIKLLLDIDKKEQEVRLKKLLREQETSWRVSDWDLKRNKRYNEYAEMMEDMLCSTDTKYAPWSIVEATDRRYATVKIYHIVITVLEQQIVQRGLSKNLENHTEEKLEKDVTQETILSKVDLSYSLTREEYEKKRKKCQNKIQVLHGELYRRRIPVILCFEGWDAAGKGGVIKRLTEKMDPRGFVVNPTSAPNDTEKAHHYLWRFWGKIPKAGHIAIFDRTWYGRVMVERVERFCSEEEWKRAYQEINDMEKDFVNAGAVVLKFWLQIDKDEQERRFKDRQENPLKQWKITEEDWRNRQKWEQYEKAVEEMILKTSTDYAPWMIVEANNKYYARIKVMEAVIKALEERLEKDKK